MITHAFRTPFAFARRAAASSLLIASLGIGVTMAPSAQAGPFDTLDRLDQDGFLSLAENLSAATHYKAVSPAEPLGVLGFDVGVEVSSTEIDEDLFDLASDGDFGTPSLLLPRVHVHKGLPFGIDIGASLGAIPDADLSLIGAELRIALVEGGVATPAIALRGSYSRAQGSSTLDVQNGALELTISKGFVMFTPYAGIGLVHGIVKPLNEEAGLAEEGFDQEKFYAGVNVNLVAVNLTAEADRTGDHTSFSAKVGMRF